MEFPEPNLGAHIPDHLRDPSYTNRYSVQWRGDNVELWFTRSTDRDIDGRAGAEVVAHLFMTRAHFENMPAALAKMIEMHQLGDESPE